MTGAGGIGLLIPLLYYSRRTGTCNYNKFDIYVSRARIAFENDEKQ